MEEFAKHGFLLAEALEDRRIDEKDKPYIRALLSAYGERMNSYSRVDKMTHARICKWISVSRKISNAILPKMIDIGLLTRIKGTKSNFMANPQILNMGKKEHYGRLMAVYKSNGGKLIVSMKKSKKIKSNNDLDNLVRTSYEEAFVKDLQSQGIKVNSMIDVVQMCKTNIELTLQVQDLVRRLEEKLTDEEKKELAKPKLSIVPPIEIS